MSNLNFFNYLLLLLYKFFCQKKYYKFFILNLRDYNNFLRLKQYFSQEQVRLDMDNAKRRKRLCRSRQGNLRCCHHFPPMQWPRLRDFAQLFRFVRLLLVVRPILGLLQLRVALQFEPPPHAQLRLPPPRAVYSPSPRVNQIASKASAFNSSIMFQRMTTTTRSGLPRRSRSKFTLTATVLSLTV